MTESGGVDFSRRTAYNFIELYETYELILGVQAPAQIDYSTLTKTEKMPLSSRHDNLSFTHYEEVAKAVYEKDIPHWLDIAEKEKLSVHELRTQSN